GKVRRPVLFLWSFHPKLGSLPRSPRPAEFSPARQQPRHSLLLPSKARALSSPFSGLLAPALHRAQGQTEQCKTTGQPRRGFRNRGRVGVRAGLLGPPPPVISTAVVLHREVSPSPQPSPHPKIALGQRIPSRIACGKRQGHQVWPDEWHCRRGPTPDRRVRRS